MAGHRHGARPQRGQQAEEESRHHRHGESEQQDGRVDGDLVQARQLPRAEAHQQAHARLRQRQRQQTARDPEHEALEEDGCGQPSPAFAEGGPNGHLPVPRLGSHEEQVGDVGAGNQQQEAHGAQQDPQRRLDVADHRLTGEIHHGAEPGVRQNRGRALVRKDRRQVRQQRLELGPHLPRRGAVGDARHAVDAEGAELHVLAVEAERPPELHLLLREREAGRHHPDDFDARPVEIDDPPNHPRIGAEAGPPQVIAEHDDGRGARPIVPGPEAASEAGRSPQHVEERRGDAGRGHALRVFRAGEARQLFPVYRDALQRPALLGVEEIERVGHRQLVELRERRRGVAEDHQPLRVGKRQRAQQHRVDDGEDGDVRPHAGRQSHQSEEREPRTRRHAAAEETELGGERHGSSLLYRVRRPHRGVADRDVLIGAPSRP